MKIQKQASKHRLVNKCKKKQKKNKKKKKPASPAYFFAQKLTVFSPYVYGSMWIAVPKGYQNSSTKRIAKQASRF